MRIATSSLYEQQTNAIDNLVVQQATEGQQLSTGKSLNQPSDNPSVIAEDLAIRTDGALGTQTSSNLTNLSNQLTTVDGALGSLTSVLQQVRSLAIQGASDTVTASQRQAIATQVNQLFQESVGLANTQFAGQYVFAGTANPAGTPVQAVGTAPNGITFTGNLQSQTQRLPNGQIIDSSVTFQQAFNFNSPDGSPDVFQVMKNLQLALTSSTVVDESSVAVNQGGYYITLGTQLNAAGFLTSIAPDGTGQISINISNASVPSGVTLTFASTATVGAIVAAIDASGTGVTAQFIPGTIPQQGAERLVLSDAAGAFQVNIVPSAGTTTAANFTSVFNLQTQANTVQQLSTQLGDIDRVIQGVSNARAFLGANIQSIQAAGSSVNAQVLNDTQVQSNIEDTDIAKVTSQFSLTQTALQAAYSTTAQLEQKSLFDYIS